MLGMMGASIGLRYDEFNFQTENRLLNLTNSFERLFRIWGEQGQAALEKSSICLLNCGPTGSETLKNLVLGGVGSITVVDGSKVEVGDLGNNFMGTHVILMCCAVRVQALDLLF